MAFRRPGGAAFNNPFMKAAERRMGGGFGGGQGDRGDSGLASAVMGRNPVVVSPGEAGGAPAVGGGPAPTAPVPAPPPTPGVTGITPGAIERRIDPGTPSLGLTGGLPPVNPSEAMRQFNPRMVQNKPNLLGPSRQQLNAPVGNIQQFLQNLRNQRGPQ